MDARLNREVIRQTHVGGRGRLTGVLTLVLLPLALATPRDAAAQATGSVRGTVVEAGSQRPLAGAQVSIAGTQRGRVTDIRGVFVIPEVQAGEVRVRVENIGYRLVEEVVSVVAGETVELNFELQTSAVGLDEIVVTGVAGGTTKRALGNSLSTVNAAAITDIAPVSSMQQLLGGRAPGVTLSASSGVVGGSSRIRIRGTGSINASNNPVVYVDGIRVFSGSFGTTTNDTRQSLNLLEAFSPNDVESIEIIKGPAAATLYGADAAAGVIQIITKKGRPATGLQWSAGFEYGQADWSTDRISTYWLCTDAQIDNPEQYPGCQVFDKSTPLSDRVLVDKPLDPKNRSLAVQRAYEENGWTEDYPCLYPAQQPCQPEPLRQGDLRNLSMSVRGGGDSYNFYMSGEKNDENGSYVNNFSDRVSGRANFGFVPSEKANFGVNVGYAVIEQQLPLSDNSSNSITRNAYRGQAGGPVSQYLPGFRNFHPEFSNWDNSVITSERLTASISGQYNPFDWWENRVIIGLDRNDRNQNTQDQIDQTGLFPNSLGSANISYNLGHQWTVDYSGGATFDVTNELTSRVATGMQLVKRRTQTHSISGSEFVADQLNLVSAAAIRNATQGFSEQTSLGFFVEEQVGWKDRLFGTAAVRVDDNSAFGRDFQVVVYPKASVSYVISDENYFNVKHVDELKLRAAWGQAGKAPAPNSADRTYEAGRTIIGDAPVNTILTDEYGNPNLKAETGSEFELGLDGSMLGGRVGLSLTWFNQRTRDALLSVDDPPSSGWHSTHFVNVGEVKNAGIELSIDASPIRLRSFQWDVIAAVSTVNNELVSFGTDAQGNPTVLEDAFGAFGSVYRHREGYPLGGLWATDVERDASGRPLLNDESCYDEWTTSCFATPVECTWDPTDPSAVCNEEFIGPSLPTRTFGLTNTIRILNNFQIYAFAEYQGGFYQWCAICSVRTRTDNNTQQINDPNLDPAEKARLLSLQTKEWIYAADFIKLRELSASYSLPDSWIARSGFTRAAITLSGRNLWMWTKYGPGTDPEVAFRSTSNFERTDYGAIPLQRRWLVSMNVNF